MFNHSTIQPFNRVFFFSLFILVLSLPVYATDTATASIRNQVNFTPWRADILPGRSISDPHPDTSFPQTMSGTEADTQFGRNVPSGSSQVGLLDVTTTSGVGDFQSVINRMNSTASGTSRLNQLQTQINQNMSQAGYIFNNKFSITSMTDSSGNLIGQANGNFTGTQTFVDGTGQLKTTTCTGTFTYDAANGYTLTSGSSQIYQVSNAPGCKTQ
ncbi:MAG: hypothetical protein ACYDBV_05260 [Nitrospiria bacterium]